MPRAVQRSPGVAMVQACGIGSVSVFPQINTAGDGGSYSIYDSYRHQPGGGRGGSVALGIPRREPLTCAPASPLHRRCAGSDAA
jgi:hypothetical protein